MSEIKNEAKLNVLMVKLAFSNPAEHWLERNDINVINSASSAHAIKILDEQDIDVVVVWLADASRTTEEVIFHLHKQNEPGGQYQLYGVVNKGNPHIKRRAYRLGIDNIRRWPEGIQQALLAEAGVDAETLRNTARARLFQDFSPYAGSDVSGRLKNISPTGAMMECEEPPPTDRLMFSFMLEPDNEEIMLESDVVWVKPNSRGRVDVGLRFINISEETADNLYELVRFMNEKPFGIQPEKQTVFADLSGVGTRLSGSYGMSVITRKGCWLVANETKEIPKIGDEIHIRFTTPDLSTKILATVERVLDFEGKDKSSRFFVKFIDAVDPSENMSETTYLVARHKKGFKSRQELAEQYEEEMASENDDGQERYEAKVTAS